MHLQYIHYAVVCNFYGKYLSSLYPFAQFCHNMRQSMLSIKENMSKNEQALEFLSKTIDTQLRAACLYLPVN